MAETKRNSVAGKVATPKTGSQPTPDSSLEALSTSIGARIKIMTTANTTLEGTLFTACPLLNVVAINTSPAPPNPASSTTLQPGDYHIVPISKIQSVQLLSLAKDTPTSFGDAGPAITRADTRRLKEREEAQVKKLQDAERKIGKGVTSEGQSVFNALDRLYATRWNGLDIVVDNAVLIHPPYDSEHTVAPRDKQQALARIKMIVDGERKKMAERARGAGSSTPVGQQRKGG